MIAIIILVVVLVIIGGGVSAHFAAERRKRLSAWAASVGLGFDANRHHGFKDRYPEFKALRSGEKNRYAHNIMHGQRDGSGQRRVVCFDYHYQTSSTNNKGHSTTQTYRFSGVIIETALPLRALRVQPENFFDKVGEFFGFDDIDFESAAFSRAFKVVSPDRRWAYDVIHPAMMEFMLARQGYTLQTGSGNMIVTDGRRWNADEFTAALHYAEGFLDRIPAGVIEEPGYV